MTSRRRLRMRIEVILAIVFALFTVVTLINPQWIEQLFAFDPDHGSGEAEWGLTAVFGVATFVATLLAGHNWRLLATESTR